MITIGDYVSEVYIIAHRDCHLIHPEGGWYWKHWASALSPEESDQFTKFYNLSSDNILMGITCQLDELVSRDYIQAMEKYKKLSKKIDKGKKYDSYTGCLLTKYRSEQYLYLLRIASQYYKFS